MPTPAASRELSKVSGKACWHWRQRGHIATWQFLLDKEGVIARTAPQLFGDKVHFIDVEACLRVAEEYNSSFTGARHLLGPHLILVLSTAFCQGQRCTCAACSAQVYGDASAAVESQELVEEHELLVLILAVASFQRCIGHTVAHTSSSFTSSILVLQRK